MYVYNIAELLLYVPRGRVYSYRRSGASAASYVSLLSNKWVLYEAGGTPILLCCCRHRFSLSLSLSLSHSSTHNLSLRLFTFIVCVEHTRTLNSPSYFFYEKEVSMCICVYVCVCVCERLLALVTVFCQRQWRLCLMWEMKRTEERGEDSWPATLLPTSTPLTTTSRISEHFSLLLVIAVYELDRDCVDD